MNFTAIGPFLDCKSKAVTGISEVRTLDQKFRVTSNGGWAQPVNKPHIFPFSPPASTATMSLKSCSSLTWDGNSQGGELCSTNPTPIPTYPLELLSFQEKQK